MPARLAAMFLGASLLCSCASPATTAAPAGQTPIAIVAAENFYGDIASQIGGSRVRVSSILSDPSTDPHTYESSVDSARAIAAARLVIKNGVGYDAFMDKLMAAGPRQDRLIIDAGGLVKAPPNSNPHLWYEPTAMPTVAQAIAERLSQLDPPNSADYHAALQSFNNSLAPLQERISAVRSKSPGAKVLPTEPLFDYMAEALGLEVVDKDGAFQKAVEEGNDPPALAVAQFRRQLASQTIKALIYNTQTETPITVDMRNTAKQNKVPVIGVSELEPPGKTYQQWMLDQLISLQQALG